MKELGVRHFPVQQKGELIGIVSMRDLSRHYEHELEAQFEESRRDFEDLLQQVDASADGGIDYFKRELERYRKLSLTDPMTGLYNKRYFDLRLREEFSRAKRHHTELALLFCDVDRFKSINDAHGHQFGDKVLCHVAARLSDTIHEDGVISKLRKSDIVARYGGEEFVVIAPETGLQGAVVAAEKARAGVESLDIEGPDASLRLTISMGVAAIDSNIASADELVQRADTALYRAKAAGRNRVVAFTG
jgi:two-component system cell cycle response regulator